MPDEDAKVVFTPSGVQASVAPGTTVLDAARRVGVDIDSTCGGRGLCGRCQITPSLGEFAKWSITSPEDAVSPWTSTESAYKGRRQITAGNRLGCQAKVVTDVVVDVPAASQVHRPVVHKKIDLDGLTLDPLLVARYVELPELELGDERADAELLREALATDWGIEGATVDARVLPNLHPAIVTGQRAITAVVHVDGTVIAVRPGFDEDIYGVAIDVGSTTIAGYLIDLATGDVVAEAVDASAGATASAASSTARRKAGTCPPPRIAACPLGSTATFCSATHAIARTAASPSGSSPT